MNLRWATLLSLITKGVKMRFKKLSVYLMVIILFLCAFVIGSQVRANDAGNPYSNKASDIIGAWYDETWQASVFYRTTSVSPNSLIYRQSFNPETIVNPTYSVAPSLFSPPAAGPLGQGEQIIPGASIPSDMVVTEWKVTGHVHFKSGL